LLALAHYRQAKRGCQAPISTVIQNTALLAY
jgi:hypothetical protein